MGVYDGTTIAVGSDYEVMDFKCGEVPSISWRLTKEALDWIHETMGSDSHTCPPKTLEKQVSIKLEKRWNPKVLFFPGILGYNSVSFAVCDQTIFVLNGGGTGNYISKFSLDGKRDGTCPGWFTYPNDLVAGPDCQLLITAMGGMVTYNEDCEFQRGFQESDTGLVRPKGLAQVSRKIKICSALMCYVAGGPR